MIFIYCKFIFQNCNNVKTKMKCKNMDFKPTKVQINFYSIVNINLFYFIFKLFRAHIKAITAP